MSPAWLATRLPEYNTYAGQKNVRATGLEGLILWEADRKNYVLLIPTRTVEKGVKNMK